MHLLVLEGDETVSMCERFKEGQMGLVVCIEEPGRAAMATNREPARLLELSAVINCEIGHAIDLVPTRQNETGGVRGLAKVLSAQTYWYGRRCSSEG